MAKTFHVPDYIAVGHQPKYKSFAEFVQRQITGQKADQQRFKALSDDFAALEKRIANSFEKMANMEL